MIYFFGLFFFLQAAQAIVNGDEKDEDLIKDVPELQNLEAETAHNKYEFSRVDDTLKA